MKKKWIKKVFERGPKYRNWMRLVSWIRRSVRWRSHREVKFFSVSGIFPGKDECHIVGFRMHHKPTKCDRIRWSYFWENRNFKCFLCKLPLILRVGWKQKIIFSIPSTKKLLKTDTLYRKLSCSNQKEVMQYFHSRRVMFIM